MGFRKSLARWIAGPPPRRRSFAGARLTRLETDWFAYQQSADQEVKASLVALRKRSRQLARDNAHAAAFVGLVRANIVGPEGMILQSRIMTARNAPNQPLNDAIEQAWYDWGCDPDQVDVGGRLTWLDVQHLVAQSWAIDGEVFLRKRVVQTSGRPTLALQFIDPDQVDETFERQVAPGSNAVRMGIEVDGDGRPVAYWVTRGHPAETGAPKERVRIPAAEILHCYLPHRPNATRGVPWLTPVMLSLKMLDGYTEAEITAARIAAAKAILYEQDADAAGDPVEIGDITEDIEPGMSKILPPGMRAHAIDPTHPTTNYPDFKKAMLREIASGAGVAYHSLAGDLEGVNLSSARVGMVQERDQWLARQQALMTQLHRRVYRAWLELAALSGVVRLPTPEPMRWCADAWVGRRWQSPDPLKDAQTAESLLGRQLTTRSDLCQRDGKDFEDVLAGLQRERELAAKYGVTLNDAPATGAGQPGGGDGGSAGDQGDGDGSDRPGAAGGDREGDRAGAGVGDAGPNGRFTGWPA